MLADPIRGSDYSRYHGVHCMTPNRLEAQLATGLTIQKPEDAFAVGRELVDRLGMEAALVTLDRDGMALVRAEGHAEIVPTRPRQVYDITGAGDMVLAVVGLCLAAGADYDEAAALGNVAGGLEVERIGVALLSRDEIVRDLLDHHHPERSRAADARRVAGRLPPPSGGRADDRLHQRLLRPLAHRPRPALAAGGRTRGFPRRRGELRRERASPEGGLPADQPRGRPRRAARRNGVCRCRGRFRRGHAAFPDRGDPARRAGQGGRLPPRRRRRPRRSSRPEVAVSC